MGFNLSETFQSSLQLFAADGHRLKVHGCLPVIIMAGPYDKPKEVQEILYFVDGFKNTVLSRKALKELGSVSQNFPEIASVSMITSIKVDEATDKPRRKYSDVVKSKKVIGDKAQITVKTRETVRSHLQQKEPSGTSLSIQNLWINKKGESVKNSAVDVVTDVRVAPLMRRSGGSMGTAGATYWRPWD